MLLRRLRRSIPVFRKQLQPTVGCSEHVAVHLLLRAKGRGGARAMLRREQPQLKRLAQDAFEELDGVMQNTKEHHQVAPGVLVPYSYGPQTRAFGLICVLPDGA